MPPRGPVTRPKKKSPTTRGPQGLPTASGGTPRRRPASPPPRRTVPAPSRPLITQVTHAAQPQVRRAVRRQRANQRISGDRPTPGGRTRGIDARKSPQYRAALLSLIGRERQRLGLGSTLENPKYTRKSVTTAQLEGELALLRVSKHQRTRNLAHPFGKDTYTYQSRVPSPLITQIQRAATGRPDRGKLVTSPIDLEAMALKDNTGKAGVEASLDAGVVKVLDQLTRPLHAVAGAANAAVTGKNIPRAASRGIQNKDKVLFSDVLKSVGAPGVVQSVGGFGLDVALDPTTYVTFGASSVARQAARSEARIAYRQALQSQGALAAAQAAAKQALKRGATEAGAKEVGKQAAKLHARRAAVKAGERVVKANRHPTNSGLQVRFAGRAVPGVTRVTSAVKRAPREAARRSRLENTRVGQRVDRAQQSVRDVSRNFASDFNPAIAPAGVDRAEYAAMREAARSARAGVQRGTFRAGQRAIAFREAIGPKNYEQVIDAMETGQIKTLPSGLRNAARVLERDFAQMQKAERRAGLKVTTRSNYVKHLRIKDPSRGGTPSVGSRKVQAGFQKERTEGTIAQKNAREPGAYSTDVAELYVNRGAESAVAITKARLNQAMVKAGRKPERGVKLREQLADNESLYVVEGSDLRKVEPKSNEAREVIDGTRRGKYVILNDKAIDRTRGTVGKTADRSTPGVFFDKATGTWKLVATQVNPGYWVRNFIGEGQNAYLKQNPITLGRNAVQAAKALKELGRQEDALRVLGSDPKITRWSQFVREAERVGAIRAGQLGREVQQLMAGESKKTAVKAPGKRGVRRRVGRTLSNVEDVFRLATYKAGIDRGLSPEKAMARASRNHFDYGDLTPLERKLLRRALPFYTFSARNIPLQIRTLLHQPGKFAQYQKLREELARAFGIDLDRAQEQSSEYDQRSAPVYVRIGGKVYPISLGPSGLPLTDLNEMPTSLDPGKAYSEWKDRAMSLLHPAIKTPVELGYNLSFFFRGPIEREEGPLVPAPSWVKFFPESVRKDLGIVPDYLNKQSGKRQWGAPAKLVYALGVLPGPISFANRLSTSSERQTKQQKVIGYLGVRTAPLDPVTNKIDRLYEQRDEIAKKRAALGQRGINADNPTTAYSRLNAQYNDITSNIMALRTKRGDKIMGGRRKSSSSSFSDPAIDKALEKLPSQGESKWSDPAIEKALKKLN